MQLIYLLKSMKTSEWIPTRMYYCPCKMTSKEYTHSKKRPKVLAFVFHASYKKSGDGKEIRNVRTEIGAKAYRAKNSGKTNQYTTTYTYHNTGSGYPAEDMPYTLCTVLSQEQNISDSTKTKISGVVSVNGEDYTNILEQKSVNGAEYQTICKAEYQYDLYGNETRGTVYPSYGTEGEKESIQNDYTYNRLGQQTKTTVTLKSAKNPADNRTYTEEAVTYDYFGNELTYTDENGLTSKTAYDPATGEEIQTVQAAGTPQESTEKEYVSQDTLKTMTLDEYGRVSIDICDGLGNTIISKDEAGGTWT